MFKKSLIHITFVMMLCSVLATSCYYLDGERVSKEDFEYCPLIDKSLWSFDFIDGNKKIKTVLIKSKPDTAIIEDPFTGELEMIITLKTVTCKEYCELNNNDSTKFN